MKKANFSDILIALIAVGIIYFIRSILTIFKATGSEPTQLVTCVFGIATAELAILWRMHESKKNRESKEDSNEEEGEG